MKEGIYMEKRMKHGDVYTAKRLRLVEYLRDNRFYPFAIVPDANNTKYNVFKYHNSPELEECLDRYFSRFNKQ
jgi:hypothetical protein